jgi:hypothetical protein
MNDRKRIRSILGLIFAISSFGLVGHISAQQTATREDTNVIPWAFAVAIGSGIYGIGDNNTIYVLRMQPRISKYFSEETIPGEHRLKLEIKLPVAFGVQNFDIIQGDFPERLQNISFAPGVEVQIPVTTRWTLRPHVHFGWGKEMGSDGESAWIYWGGLKSLFSFGAGKFDFGLVNSLTRGGYTPNMGKARHLSVLGTGLEIDHPLFNLKSGGDQLYLKSHVFNFWYFDQLELFLSPDRDPVQLRMEWEIGLAIGKIGKLKIWLFKFDRIGIGYRFSDYTKGIRIFVNSYFN